MARSLSCFSSETSRRRIEYEVVSLISADALEGVGESILELFLATDNSNVEDVQTVPSMRIFL